MKSFSYLAACLTLLGSGCEPAASARGNPGDIYTIDRVAGDEHRAVYHVRHKTTGKIHVMAWSHVNSGGMWVKVEEISPMREAGNP